MRLNDTEWTIMNALWQRSPATARDVLDAVSAQTNWAYTTVKTLLERLVAKGALAEHKRANTSWYEPVLRQDDARRSALHSLVERAFGGAVGSLVQHFLSEEQLTRADREQLRAMLDLDRAKRVRRSRRKA